MTQATDRHGYHFADLVAIQDRDLSVWASKLRPACFEAVSTYVKAQNAAAPTPNDRHRVLRGQDIVQIIFEWPDLKPYYPKPGSELI